MFSFSLSDARSQHYSGAMLVWKHLRVRVDPFFNSARYCILGYIHRVNCLVERGEIITVMTAKLKPRTVEIKTIPAACSPPLAAPRAFFHFTPMIAMYSPRALFFSLTFFFRNPLVNTFASTIDGIRRTLTIVNGEAIESRDRESAMLDEWIGNEAK